MAHKVGVIPFDIVDGEIILVLVTSKTRGRWVLPKGNLKTGEAHKKGCKREALEEAGLKGKILTDFPVTVPVGKSTDGALAWVPVTFYPMWVTEELPIWEESEHRDRCHVSLQEAGVLAGHDDYQHVIALFADLAPWLAAKRPKKKK